MGKGYLGTGFSWSESRVLFEIYSNQGINAAELCGHLNIDKSYVSRLLAKFEEKGVITRKLVPGSKGVKKIYLTDLGKEEARRIDRNGDKQISAKLSNLEEEDCGRLCEAMALIEEILSKNDKE
ncbi:MarR family transcriptional regulator [bacterium D16-51]|nr:MarR family transcriptional regulator [bacterium D16-59]RKI62030.1 MarR family transcriptional regulator [bacterium D16-51]